MNNLKNLYPCLESIKKYTKVSYECFVVAFFFSKDNLEKLRKDFPWVKIIESNEYRGFAENNNLALRQANGKYCWVLNDDTYMDQPVIDKMVETIESLPEDAACVSPKSLFPDGRLQSCGRPPHTFRTTLLEELKLYNEQKVKSRYTNQPGIFETATVVGAFFLIKTDLFRKIGWFNERYYFCPEDVEVGMKLHDLGYKCYVNSDVYIYHTEGTTYKLSKTRAATVPTSTEGALLLYGNTPLKHWILLHVTKAISLAKSIYWKRKIKKPWDGADIMYHAQKNTYKYLGSGLTTKEIFVKCYEEAKNGLRK
jgi:GT2 family glycosyltransferase